MTETEFYAHVRKDTEKEFYELVSGLWKEFARIIREVRPRYAFLENSPMLLSRGLGRVLGDLAEIGYDAECLLRRRAAREMDNRGTAEMT